MEYCSKKIECLLSWLYFMNITNFNETKVIMSNSEACSSWSLIEDYGIEYKENTKIPDHEEILPYLD